MKRALWGAALAVVFVAGCKSATLEKQGEVKPTAPVAAAPQAAAPAQPAAAAEDAARGYEILKLTAQVPPEVAERAARQASCPRSFLSALFGVDFSNPHGCIIGQLTPGGLAEQAGLKVGDSIVSCNDQPVTCPSVLDPVVRAAMEGPEQGKLVLVIHRPLVGSGG